MSDPASPDYRSLMISAIVMAVVGWIGLYLLLNVTLPTVGPRWLFFFLWTLAATGTSLPFIWLLHRRFVAGVPSPAGTLLRQALWVGLYAAICIWLQVNRSLSLTLALLIAIGLLVVEWFVHAVERTTWKPQR